MSDSPLAVTIAGLTFKNPVIPASGTFGYGLEFLP
ncbi:MAG: dihydroorotate dehydrogenase catalytic subunit, partial [Chloracidobacterium sp.]